MLKGFLSQRGISYQDHDVSVDPNAGAELYRLTGQMGVPVTIIDGQAVIGFDQVKLEQLLAAAPSKPSLGAAVGDAAKITRMRGLPTSTGAYVGAVKPGSLAQKIGLLVGDVITDINGRSVNSPDDVETILAGLNAGSRITISFTRGEQRLTASGMF